MVGFSIYEKDLLMKALSCLEPEVSDIDMAILKNKIEQLEELI
jgi:hypothetical protein